MPNDHATACYQCHRDMSVPVSIFDHDGHQDAAGGKDSCEKCHDLTKPQGRENAPACVDCHEKDMPGLARIRVDRFSSMAPGYQDAMHGVCLTCHRRFGEEMECMTEPECVGNCQACHPIATKPQTAMNQ